MEIFWKYFALHLWFPAAVMLHARPTSHKLTGKRFGQKEKTKTCFWNYLKKVVDPPEPYSSTSMSGFRTEHINSTPHLSSITVLPQRIGNEIHKSNTEEEILSPSHGWFKGEGEVVLIETPLPSICHLSLPTRICRTLPTQLKSVEWQCQRLECGSWQRQTWHWWCWLEAATWLGIRKTQQQGLI